MERGLRRRDSGGAQSPRGAGSWMTEGGSRGTETRRYCCTGQGEGTVTCERRGQKPDLGVTHGREGDTRTEGDHRRRLNTSEPNCAPCFSTVTKILRQRRRPLNEGSNRGQVAVPPLCSLFPSTGSSTSFLLCWAKKRTQEKRESPQVTPSMLKDSEYFSLCLILKCMLATHVQC